MDSIYSSAKAIISRAQPSLDGGIITFTLNNLIKLPSSNHYNESSSHTEVTIIDHILSTYSRTGYALGIVCALLWTILLIIASCLTCRQRKRIKKRSETLLYLAPTENHTLNTSRETIEIALHKKHSPKSTFYKTRERLQSNWICLAIQFSLLTILTILLGIAVLLGFAACGQLHTNLVSSPTYEESFGRLLTTNELIQTNPEKTHVFPRILRALAQIKIYLNEFIPQTKIDIEPIIKNLIKATELMQDRMTNEFNTILFNQIGITEAFELGDILGEHVITLMTKYISIVQSNNAFKHIFDRLKIEFQTWLHLMNIENFNNNNIIHCNEQCNELRSTFYNNITIRPDSFMPDINFAIALKFLTTDRNQTAENIQNQLNYGKQLSKQQLENTKIIMNQQINIPQSIRNITNKQWNQFTPYLYQIIEKIDKLSIYIIRYILPKVTSISNLLLTFNLLFWFIILLITISLIWLIIRYHFIPTEISIDTRNRIRLGASIGLCILAISILLACIFYLIGGYFYTEGCRYIDPEQNIINITDYDPIHQYTIQRIMFPIDSHINSYINHHWSTILSIANQYTHMPIPHIRSPIYGILHNCRYNQGILKAMNSIEDYNMKSLNDPEMSKRFIHLGKEIMINSLKSINVNEMFPKETDDNLAMASRLDDFIVNYNEVRLKLPKTYISIQSSSSIDHDNNNNHNHNYILWPIENMWKQWDIYYTTILTHYLSIEQLDRLNNVTDKIRQTFLQLNHIIHDIDQNLIVLSKLNKIAPYVAKLQKQLIHLKTIMNNKTILINQAIELYDKHIQLKTPIEAEKLIIQYGPEIMSKVGQCYRLYSAMNDINNAICHGIISILNGFWFLLGWVTLIGTLIIIFSLLLLMHKSPIDNNNNNNNSN
ncbi:unnamed protein product, partial [Schistosoma spindalis]